MSRSTAKGTRGRSPWGGPAPVSQPVPLAEQIAHALATRRTPKQEREFWSRIESWFETKVEAEVARRVQALAKPAPAPVAIEALLGQPKPAPLLMQKLARREKGKRAPELSTAEIATVVREVVSLMLEGETPRPGSAKLCAQALARLAKDLNGTECEVPPAKHMKGVGWSKTQPLRDFLTPRAAEMFKARSRFGPWPYRALMDEALAKRFPDHGDEHVLEYHVRRALKEAGFRPRPRKRRA